jgi:hypothetical protein
MRRLKNVCLFISSLGYALVMGILELEFFHNLLIKRTGRQKNICFDASKTSK